MSSVPSTVPSVVPSVVFVVPYRDRDQQYQFFDKHMRNTVLASVAYTYKILYVHQCDSRSFNRGALKNIGFLYLKATYPADYKNITLVFHDVDNMPFTGNFIHYPTVAGVVKHFYGFTFALGGMVSITGGDFEKVGGFPNFWAWGFEDNMLHQRVLKAGISVDRSQFYPIYDKNVLHFMDGIIRDVNRAEFDRYVGKNSLEGYAGIRDLRYSYDASNGFVNVQNFVTEYLEDKSKSKKHDLRDGSHPFQVGRPKGGQGGRWGMTFVR